MTTSISAPAPRRWPSSSQATHAFAEVLKAAKRPLIIVGQGALARAGRRGGPRARGASSPQASARSRRAGTASPCCTPPPRASAASTSASCRARAASTPPAMAQAGALDVLFLLGADEIDVAPRRLRRLSSARMATAARTAPTSSCRARPTPKSPAPTSTPRAACRSANRAAFPPGEAREDWAILRALSDVLGKTLPFDSLRAAARASSMPTIPHFARDRRRSQPATAPSLPTLAATRRRRLGSAASRRRSTDFYLTNPIARASARHGRMLGAGPRRLRPRRRSKGRTMDAS